MSALQASMGQQAGPTGSCSDLLLRPDQATHRWRLELPGSGVNPPGPLPVARRDLPLMPVYTPWGVVLLRE